MSGGIGIGACDSIVPSPLSTIGGEDGGDDLGVGVDDNAGVGVGVGVGVDDNVGAGVGLDAGVGVSGGGTVSAGLTRDDSTCRCVAGYAGGNPPRRAGAGNAADAPLPEIA